MQAWPDRRVFTGGSVSLAAAPAVSWSADASLLPVTPYCHQGICAGDFISIHSPFTAAFSRNKQSFWKYSCWFLMTASVWVTGSKLPMWNIQSGLLWETCFWTNISSHSSVGLWCIAAFLLVYLSMRLQDFQISLTEGPFHPCGLLKIISFSILSLLFIVSAMNVQQWTNLHHRRNLAMNMNIFHYGVISTKYQMMYGV